MFARISDKGVITSQARNGATNNRDAIGREPLVQIVLRDVTNSQVVDVRYFKIQWTAVKENTDLGNLGAYTDLFNRTKCGETYTNFVGEESMNNVYAKLDIEKEAFHKLYKLDTNVYASAAEAIAGTPASTKLGDITDIIAEGSTMTHNLKWNFAIVENPITPAEYAAGKAVRTVYGRYEHNVNSEVSCTFELTLTLDIAKMAFTAGYHQSYWNTGAALTNTNKDKTFLVNPALTSDAVYGIANFYDCQMVASMLKGYNSNTVNILKPLDLVSNADHASLKFDADRLSDILGAGWSTNGITLSKNGVIAASILENGIISLEEIPAPTVNTHGIPTSAAKELLGKTVPVKLLTSYCNGTDKQLYAEMDHFLVKFINPLEINLADVTDSFTDLISGGSKVSINSIATIKETFGLKRTVWENGMASIWNKLGQWYNVQNVTWNLSAAKTNLKKEGNNIIITDNPLASNWSDFSNEYKLSADTQDGVNASMLTFENNSGAALQQAIQISVPVYAQTKWAPKLTDSANQYVTLTVNPGVTQ